MNSNEHAERKVLALIVRFFLDRYCTSDGYLGDSVDDPDGGSYLYRGRRVVLAAIRQLQERHGMAGFIVFGGSSAGGRGAMFNLDAVAAMLDDSYVVGLLDSPLWLDTIPYNISMISLREQTKLIVSRVNAKDSLSVACLEAAGSEGEWKCAFGEYLMPYIRSPYLLIQSQDDRFQLEENGVSGWPTTVMEALWVSDFHTRLQGRVLSARDNAPEHSAIYSQACFL